MKILWFFLKIILTILLLVGLVYLIKIGLQRGITEIVKSIFVRCKWI